MKNETVVGETCPSQSRQDHEDLVWIPAERFQRKPESSDGCEKRSVFAWASLRGFAPISWKARTFEWSFATT